MIILHLTDIHADIHNPQSFLSRFQGMLKALSCLPPAWKPDVIALTGDFGYLGISIIRTLYTTIIQRNKPHRFPSHILRGKSRCRIRVLSELFRTI